MIRARGRQRGLSLRSPYWRATVGAVALKRKAICAEQQVAARAREPVGHGPLWSEFLR